MRETVRFLLGNEPREIRARRPDDDGARLPAPGRAALRHQGRLRRGRLRRLHRGARAAATDGRLRLRGGQRLHPLRSARSTAASVVTVEDLKRPDGALHPVQQAMVDDARLAVRLLHAGLRHVALRAADAADRARRATPSIERRARRAISAAAPATGRSSRRRSAMLGYGAAARTAGRRARSAIAGAARGPATTARASTSATGRRRFVAPAIVDELADVSAQTPDATIVAGATDVGLWVTKFMRDIAPADLHRRARRAAAASRRPAARLTIGAGVTYTDADAGAGARIYPRSRRAAAAASAASRCATRARSAATSPTARRSATRRRR